VYELNVDKAVGDAAEIEAYTPVYIGNRKITYWLCVYYDLNESKIVATSNLVSYAELSNDMAGGGPRQLVLAEYLIKDISKTTPEGATIPFAGTKEYREYKELTKQPSVPSDETSTKDELEKTMDSTIDSAMPVTDEIPETRAQKLEPEPEQQMPGRRGRKLRGKQAAQNPVADFPETFSMEEPPDQLELPTMGDRPEKINRVRRRYTQATYGLHPKRPLATLDNVLHKSTETNNAMKNLLNAD
jgi:hypothetical protein